jgi:hypothetical protein
MILLFSARGFRVLSAGRKRASPMVVSEFLPGGTQSRAMKTENEEAACDDRIRDLLGHLQRFYSAIRDEGYFGHILFKECRSHFTSHSH